jgi:hypothetical protein
MDAYVSSRQVLLLVAAASIIVVLVGIALSQPTTPAMSRYPLTGSAALVGATTPQASSSLDATFDFHLDEGLYAGQDTRLAADAQRALDYVSQRTGYQQKHRYRVAITVGAGCSIRGVAFPDGMVAQALSCGDIDSSQAIVILAHELVHLLTFDRYGVPPAVGSDLMLVEGVATYGAGQYWLGGHPDFRSYVHDQRAAGVAYPLTEGYGASDAETMNARYYQWASFVEFLKSLPDGDAKFDQLYISGDGHIGSSDYEGIYGQSLGNLEQAWISWLDS